MDSFLRMVQSPTTAEQFPRYLAGSQEFRRVAKETLASGGDNEADLLHVLLKDIARITML